MSRKERWIWLGLAVLAAIALLFLARAVGAVEMSFMPKGGRALAAEAFAGDEAALRSVMSAKRTEAEWDAYLASRGLRDRDRATLAGYLATHAPLSADAMRGSLAQSLPRDGRELAWSECQSCHTLSHAMLAQSRDADAWRKLLASPSHRAIRISASDREELARYATLNMPMNVADIPASMR